MFPKEVGPSMIAILFDTLILESFQVFIRQLKLCITYNKQLGVQISIAFRISRCRELSTTTFQSEATPELAFCVEADSVHTVVLVFSVNAGLFPPVDLYPTGFD